MYLSSPKLLHWKTLEGMRKWHLEKHSMQGTWSCSGFRPQCSPHVQWSHMSILAFYWHGKVMGHEWMPVELQPELVNIYFQAHCCQRRTNIHFCGASLRQLWYAKLTGLDTPCVYKSLQWRNVLYSILNLTFWKKCFLLAFLPIVIGKDWYQTDICQINTGPFSEHRKSLPSK